MLKSQKKKYAVIDIGSSTTCLSVFEVSGTELLTMHYQSDVLKLGMYLDGDYCLPQEAIDRLSDSLSELVRVAYSYEVQEIFCLATSVLRQCNNAAEVLSQCESNLSEQIQVISEQEEGELALASVEHFFDLSDKKALIMDMGGGSTEMLLVNYGKMILNKSVPTGLSKLKKQIAWEEVSLPNRQHLNAAVSDVIQNFLTICPTKTFDFMVMTSSTIKMIGAIQYPDLELLDLKDKMITEEDCEQVIEKIQRGETFAKVEEEKRDLVYLGASVLKGWFQQTNLKNIHICPWSIREGFLLKKLI